MRTQWKISLIALTVLVGGCQNIEQAGRTVDLSVTKRQNADGCQLNLDMRNLGDRTIKPRLDYAIVARTGLVLKKGQLSFGDMIKKDRKVNDIYLPGVGCGDIQKFFVAQAVDERVSSYRQGYVLHSIDDKSYRW